MTKEVPNFPPLKKFKPKTDLRILDSYRYGADNDYWSGWPAISWETVRMTNSEIHPDLLYSMAVDCAYPYSIIDFSYLVLKTLVLPNL